MAGTGPAMTVGVVVGITTVAAYGAPAHWASASSHNDPDHHTPKIFEYRALISSASRARSAGSLNSGLILDTGVHFSGSFTLGSKLREPLSMFSCWHSFEHR